MRNNASNDRRTFARMPTAIPARLLAYGQDKECVAQTVDISATGVGLLTNVKLSPLTPLEMWLDLPETASPFYTRGEVVWSSSKGEVDRQRLGVRLDKAELMGLAPVLWK